MRTLLLLVLGAGIVWFVWRGLGPSQGAVGEAQAAPGSMLTVEAATAAEPATGTPDALGAPVQKSAEISPDSANSERRATAAHEEAASAGATSAARPGAVPVPTEPRPAAAAAVITPPSGTTSATSPEEIAACEELLRDRVAFEAHLLSRGSTLAPARQEVASAFLHALAARDSEARAALDRAEASGGLRPGERDLAQRIAAGRGGLVIDTTPIGRAASVVAEERSAFADLDAGRFENAARSFSRLLLAEIDSPWRADVARLERWSLGVREAQRQHRWNRRGSWRSVDVVVQPGDSLIQVRKRAVAADPNLVVCTGQIARANGLEGEVIHPGMKLRIPLDPVRVVVDLDAHWAFYLAGEEVVAAWPVGVGSETNATRVGTYAVGAKKSKEPMWFPQGRKPVPYGDPENPLGTRWIPWDGPAGEYTGLGFHGTNDPSSIGRDASLGCIRMWTPDVEELYEVLPVGASIHVRS